MTGIQVNFHSMFSRYLLKTLHSQNTCFCVFHYQILFRSILQPALADKIRQTNRIFEEEKARKI